MKIDERRFVWVNSHSFLVVSSYERGSYLVRRLFPLVCLLMNYLLPREGNLVERKKVRRNFLFFPLKYPGNITFIQPRFEDWGAS